MTSSANQKSYFEAKTVTAVDVARDVEIFRPRLIQMEDSDRVEYNFTVNKGGASLGFSCDGNVHVSPDRSAKWEFVFKPSKSFTKAMECAQKLAPDLPIDKLPLYLADGMLATFAEGTAIFTNMELVVLIESSQTSHSAKEIHIGDIGATARVALLSLSVQAQPYPDEDGEA